MLELKNISYQIGGRDVLKNISFRLEQGQIYGLVGTSGIGKSTLLKLISGYLDATEGEILLFGKRVVGPSMRLLPGHPDIELVNQDFALDIYHTVRENIRQKSMYLPKDMSEALIDEILDVLELVDLQHQKAHQLSGGEQQRLALGRALAKEPDLMLLDEPFAHLDVHLKKKLATYLVQLNQIRKTSYILVSHDGQEVLSLADQIMYMNHEGIQRMATSQEFYYQPESEFEALFFGDINKVIDQQKEILFRPNEYELEGDGLLLQVTFIRKIFGGAYDKFYFQGQNKETFVLYSNTDISHETQIRIRKKI